MSKLLLKLDFIVLVFHSCCILKLRLWLTDVNTKTRLFGASFLCIVSKYLHLKNSKVSFHVALFFQIFYFCILKVSHQLPRQKQEHTQILTYSAYFSDVAKNNIYRFKKLTSRRSICLHFPWLKTSFSQTKIIKNNYFIFR